MAEAITETISNNKKIIIICVAGCTTLVTLLGVFVPEARVFTVDIVKSLVGIVTSVLSFR